MTIKRTIMSRGTTLEIPDRAMKKEFFFTAKNVWGEDFQVPFNASIFRVHATGVNTATSPTIKIYGHAEWYGESGPESQTISFDIPTYGDSVIDAVVFDRLRTEYSGPNDFTIKLQIDSTSNFTGRMKLDVYYFEIPDVDQ